MVGLINPTKTRFQSNRRKGEARGVRVTRATDGPLPHIDLMGDNRLIAGTASKNGRRKARRQNIRGDGRGVNIPSSAGSIPAAPTSLRSALGHMTPSIEVGVAHNGTRPGGHERRVEKQKGSFG